MVACFARNGGGGWESRRILGSQVRAGFLYPRLELVATAKMESVQERPLIVVDRRCPLTGPNRLLELPYIDPHQVRIEPQLSTYREDDIAGQRMSDRVDRLIERVLCPRGRALRPEVRLDAGARETLPTG